jgi:hypothetical protein
MSRKYCSIYSQLPRGESGRIRRGEADRSDEARRGEKDVISHFLYNLILIIVETGRGRSG